MKSVSAVLPLCKTAELINKITKDTQQLRIFTQGIKK